MAEEKVTCVNCNKDFENKEKLMSHSNNEHKELQVECFCGNRFTCEKSQIHHFNEQHSK
jgi:hypothetical protein